DRPGHLIIGNDGGLNISYDDGLSWFKANTPPLGQFYSVEVDMQTPYNVFGGLQDNGVWTGPSTYRTDVSWQQYGKYPYKFIMGGDGMQVQVDTRDNATVYTGYQFGYYYRLNMNDEDVAVPIKPRNDIGEANFRFNWQSPICLSRHVQDVLYFGSNKFHRSTMKGDDMKALSPDLSKNDKKGDVPYNTLTTIAESPMRFGLIYSGADDGSLWISKDVGYSWTDISKGLPKDLYISRVSPSSKVEGRVYVSLNGYRNDHFAPYIFVSEDYGENWKSISSSLPHEPVNVIREDIENENLLFAGTDNGFYLSLNRGKEWMSMNGALPRVAVHDAIIHPRDGEIVIGTHGRSLYAASLAEIRLLNDSVLNTAVEILKVTAPNFSKNWGKSFDVFSDPAVPNLKLNYFSKDSGQVNIRVLTDKGIEVKNLTDTAEAGINLTDIKLSIEESVALKLSNSRDKKKHPYSIAIKAEDGAYYIPAGVYKVEIKSVNGILKSKSFEILVK
ncbi:MAG: glycosyl hydrolase, partial [Bacteroidia bacterium]|nr:glycosyl hydrolase [Bacteroidia bacterium]